MNEAQQRIIDLVLVNPMITTQAIAESLNFTRRKVDYHISQLKKAGLLEREGAKKNGRWIARASDGHANSRRQPGRMGEQSAKPTSRPKKYGGTND